MIKKLYLWYQAFMLAVFKQQPEVYKKGQKVCCDAVNTIQQRVAAIQLLRERIVKNEIHSLKDISVDDIKMFNYRNITEATFENQETAKTAMLSCIDECIIDLQKASKALDALFQSLAAK